MRTGTTWGNKDNDEQGGTSIRYEGKTWTADTCGHNLTFQPLMALFPSNKLEYPSHYKVTSSICHRN